jgi:sRNA-binding carbon storage regulator CsrA
MLVLTRKKDERIFIVVPGMDEPIVISCVGTYPEKTRLGFDAPPDVVIDREEIFIGKRDNPRG